MRKTRNRLLVGLTLPLAAALIILIVVLNLSVILLALEAREMEAVATAVAILVATLVLFVAAYFSVRGEDGSTKSAVALLGAGFVLVFAGFVGAEAIEEEDREAQQGRQEEPELGPPDITVTAGPGFTFQENQLVTDPGEIVIEYVNADTVAHTLLFDGVAGFKLQVGSKGDIDKGAVDLEPGRYVYFCDIPGHRPAGMQGTLTVD